MTLSWVVSDVYGVFAGVPCTKVSDFMTRIADFELYMTLYGAGISTLLVGGIEMNFIIISPISNLPPPPPCFGRSGDQEILCVENPKGIDPGI